MTADFPTHTGIAEENVRQMLPQRCDERAAGRRQPTKEKKRIEEMLCDSCGNHVLSKTSRSCNAGVNLNPYIWGCVYSWKPKSGDTPTTHTHDEQRGRQ